MNNVQTVKKIGKGLGIGFLGMLFLGTIISDSEKTGIIEQMEKELAEYSREVKALKTTNEQLEKDVSKKRKEYEELEEIFEELEKQLAELEQAPVAVPAIDPVRDEPVEEEVVEPVVVNKDIERLQIQEVSSENTYGILTITISLIADRDYRYIDIEIPVYDSEGYLIGSAIGFASDIKAGQKAKVECTSFDAGTYKLEELTVDSY